MKMRIALCLIFSVFTAVACIWDADTLENEKKERPKYNDIIFGEGAAPADPKPLRERIEKLKTTPREGDPAWWNDLAGAHIRLGESEEAVKLLTPLLDRFPDDYGIHANLGTAYHLLGRYVEAEKHIARDLELNRDAHFGLEKYHLALLQYLTRDQEYQREHLYIDEWTQPFREQDPEFLDYPWVQPATSAEAKADLAADPKFEEGVLYMASLNQKEPACFVMLGIACCVNRDFNLAVGAWEKAIALGSPQAELLQDKIKSLKIFIENSHSQKTKSRVIQRRGLLAVNTVVLICLVGVSFAAWLGIQAFRYRNR